MKLPKQDTFFRDRPNYEAHDYSICMSHCESRGTAIDIGAHVGYWSSRLVNDFEQVVAFEPVAEHLDCLRQNVTAPNLQIEPYAVGIESGTELLEIHLENSGMCRISTKGRPVSVKSIDSYNLAHVDLVKIDVEGYEVNVLLGMQDTISRCRPLIFIEVLPNGPAQAVKEILTGHGYEHVAQVECNQIWRCNE